MKGPLIHDWPRCALLHAVGRGTHISLFITRCQVRSTNEPWLATPNDRSYITKLQLNLIFRIMASGTLEEGMSCVLLKLTFEVFWASNVRLAE